MAVWLDRLASGKEAGVSTVWLNFYVYVRIPLGILLSLIQGIPAGFLAYPLQPSVVVFTLAFAVFDICLAIFLLIGLHRRRLWGWKLNWFVLVLEVFVRPIGKMDDAVVYFTIVTGLALVWFLPNAIYFKKRRHLFS